MIWLAWRQQRFAVIAAAVLVAIYGGMATAAHLDAEFATITQLFAGYLTIGVCMFWGAPLVARDLEQGTHRLAWTQSKPRTHWLTTRLAVAGVGALATAAAITTIVSLALPAAAVDPTRSRLLATSDDRGGQLPVHRGDSCGRHLCCRAAPRIAV